MHYLFVVQLENQNETVQTLANDIQGFAESVHVLYQTDKGIVGLVENIDDTQDNEATGELPDFFKKLACYVGQVNNITQITKANGCEKVPSPSPPYRAKWGRMRIEDFLTNFTYEDSGEPPLENDGFNRYKIVNRFLGGAGGKH